MDNTPNGEQYRIFKIGKHTEIGIKEKYLTAQGKISILTRALSYFLLFAVLWTFDYRIKKLEKQVIEINNKTNTPVYLH